MFGAVELISKKRSGGVLSSEEITGLISAYTADEVPDYQMAAMAMAIFFRGLNESELETWTTAMIESGDRIDLTEIDRPAVDKHSTGGVGDKVSIPLAPMVASCGVAIPMISGRALGHTGGTLDKLESIPGFTTSLDGKRFMQILSEIGLVMAGQSETMVPADRKLYALRDTTGTIPSIPLIASSIMSKKLAEDIDGLVLDVKVGDGAFMDSPEQALILAETMASLGRSHNVRVVAVLTNMDQPLGREVGNFNEIRESIDILRGKGPPDITALTFKLGEEMLMLGGVAPDRPSATALLDESVSSGSALAKFEQVIEAQGGDPRIVEDPSLLPKGSKSFDLAAPASGFIMQCSARHIGVAAAQLGAGREHKEDDVDPGVGITVLAKLGEHVESGQPMARITYNDESTVEGATHSLQKAWQIGVSEPRLGPMIIDEVRR